MTCNTCTKVKPVSDCASSVVIGTIENAGADVIVTVANVTLNRVDKYETTADGDGLVTIEGIKLSRFTYEITVALASAPDLNIIWSITDGSITQNVNCAVFKAASGGAEKLLPIPGTEGVVPNPPTGLGTNDIADESNYQEANLTDALNKIRVDAQQTQNSLQGLLASIPLEYTAQITQSGTDAPVANVLRNTLGGTVVWTYTPNDYIGTLAGAFPETQIIIHYAYGIDSSVTVIWGSVDTIIIQDPNDSHMPFIPMYLQILIYP